jgi:hypothetical protein
MKSQKPPKLIKKEIWIEAETEAQADLKIKLILDMLQFLKDGDFVGAVGAIGAYSIAHKILYKQLF